MSFCLNSQTADSKDPHHQLEFSRILFLICPSGSYCREDRCQSFFSFELVPSMRPPLEECEAAGAVRELGVDHRIIDAPASGLTGEEFLSEVQLFSPDLVVIAATFGSLDADVKWANQIREIIPEVPIGLRGAPAYVWSEKFLSKNSPIDFCMIGDYEIVIDEILRCGLSEARGVVRKDSGGKIVRSELPLADSLDDLPLADRSSLDNSLYTVRGVGEPQATIHVQRGCPFPCTYCLVHTVSGKKARHRSPDSIASEVRSLLDTGVSFFYLRAETFSLNREWALEVARALQQRCKGAHWVTTTRVECVDDELLREFKKAGCYGLSFGIDVTSDEIAQKVKKPVLQKEAKVATRLCDRHGILSLGYFMIGFPWETEDSLSEAAAFVKSVRPDLVTVHYAHPYPGTSYYHEVQKLGLEVSSLRAQSEMAFSPPALQPGRLEAAGKALLVKHYSRIRVLVSIARKLIPLIVQTKMKKLRPGRL